jgi:ATP/maltotriose-dependent transcriptional regulator MalT
MLQTLDFVGQIRVITVEDHFVTQLGIQPCSARRQKIVLVNDTEEKCLTEDMLYKLGLAVPSSSTSMEKLDSSFWSRTLPEALSRRETEVLGLIVEGLTNKNIATKLAVSLATAKSHVRHILNKLAVNDRTQAAVSAIRLGIV